jgi:TP901 family phage tail tape measure protein
MTAITDKNIYSGKPNPFDDVTKGADILKQSAKELLVVLEDISKITKEGIKSNNKQDAQSLRKLSEDQSKLNQVNRAAKEINTEKIRLERTLKKLNSDKIQQNEQLKVQVQTQRKLNKELARDQLNLINSFEKLTKQTNAAQARFKNLATQFGVNSKQAKAAKREFEKLDNRLSKVNKAARDGRRDVGQYAKGWQGLKKLFVGGLGILGVTAGFSAIRSGITKLVSTFSEFEKQVSKVGAISGASKDDLGLLTAQAQALGEATEKTASEVAQLQLELAKLGFDPKQIQAATDSILDLSTAVDADLGESAKVTGATLRAFSLEAEETSRVTDVMALAFSRSSLDIQKFSTAMSTVAPVAKAFGFSIEDTTSLLAQLTDAGFDASAAGTATRNILLNLADTNGELAKRLGGSVDNMEDLLAGLEKLNDEGVDLNETLQLTDKRSVAAFNRFINATDQTRKLTKELENAEGSAARMARIMRDNLAGDTDKARSAVQGLFINLGKRLNPELRKATQNFTTLVGKLNELVKVKASEEIEKERTEVIKLVARLQDANISYEDRVTLLEELNQLAPDVAKGINAETIEYGKLNIQLDDYLDKVILRISLAKAELEQQDNLNKSTELYGKATERLLNIQETLLKVSDEYRVTEGGLQKQIEGTIDLLREEVKAQFESGKAGKEYLDIKGNIIDTRTNEQKLLKSLTDDYRTVNRIEQEARDIAEKSTDEINIRIAALKELLGITDNINEETEDTVTTTNKATKATREYIEAIEILQAVASQGITIKLGTEFPDQRTDNEKFIDDLVSRNAQKSIESNNRRIEEITARNQTIEDLERQHYDSLLSIAFNFANKKAAQDQALSNEELQTVMDNNAQKEAAYQQLADTLIGIANSILQTQLRNIDQEIAAKNQQINEQEQLVNREFELLQNGAANEYATEKEKLEKIQRERDKDIAERKKIQKQQEQINTLIQISELATAVATIISSAVGELGWVGVVAGLAAAAAAIVGFTTYKGEAETAATAEDGGVFTRKGAFIEKGNRHSQGGNRYNALETERDEMHGILSRDATRKHGVFYEDITNALNTGKLNPDEMEMYNYSLTQLTPSNMIINNNYTELLSEIRHTNHLLSSKKTPLFDPKGRFKLFDNYGKMKYTEQ